MGAENEYKKRLWTQEEDRILLKYVSAHGRGQWNRIPKMTGLKRGGKSCRLRWLNYLSPNVKRGDFSEEEEELIIRLHNLLGNRWSLIAGRVPGRTDNQVKNHWNTHLCKKLGINKIKKQKGKVVSSSMTQPSSVRESPKLPDNLNIEHLQSSTKPVTAQDPKEKCNEDQAESINHLCDESLSFITDDHLNLHSPGLMEFLEGYPYPLDLIWQND